MTRIVIELRDGMIQGVYDNDFEGDVEVLVKDYDIEGEAEKPIHSESGGLFVLYFAPQERDLVGIDNLFALHEKNGQPEGYEYMCAACGEHTTERPAICPLCGDKHPVWVIPEEGE